VCVCGCGCVWGGALEGFVSPYSAPGWSDRPCALKAAEAAAAAAEAVVAAAEAEAEAAAPLHAEAEIAEVEVKVEVKVEAAMLPPTSGLAATLACRALGPCAWWNAAW
jgi:hypothetical protein